ncbi:IucA/IucC family protein [Actinomycetes bacterium KLBMP 9797]
MSAETAAPDPDETLAVLRRHRPDLVEPYRRALPGARAAILARLWGAFAREPLPGITGQHRHGGSLTVTLAGGATLTGPADAAEPYARAPENLAITRVTDPENLAITRVTDPVALLATLPADTTALQRELANSVANLALARANTPRKGKGKGNRNAGEDLVDVEQSVVDGHPLHPCCRTRLGMSTLEVLAYAPEHRPTVDLPLVDVPADRWLGDAPPRLVMHPWQYARATAEHPWLRATATTPARPLMSLRTLAVRDYHLKTAVDVQMTSAVRTVSPAAVRNGPAVSAFLARIAPPGLEILVEDRAGAILVDGAPSRGLAYVRRRAPRLRQGETAVPLAALALPREHFARLVDVLMTPLLTLLDLGVALEAHGQNTLVVLENQRPTRVIYRDVGGVRLSPARLRARGIDPPPLHGDLATDDPEELRTKLLAAAVSGVLAEQINRLGEEQAHWDTVAMITKSALGSGVLFRDTLPVKATTAMRLAADPLTDVWAYLPNPMTGKR